MRKFTLMALLVILSLAQTFAHDGYRVTVKLTGVKDTTVYLAHYYAKGLPTIYKSDSAHFNSNGVAVLESKQHLVGGIYMVLLSDQKTYCEFLLDNGEDVGITLPGNVAVNELPEKVKFEHSPENERFQAYEKYLNEFGQKQRLLLSAYESAKTTADSSTARELINNHAKELNDYRKNYVAKYPHTLLAAIFKALEPIQIPEGKHLLSNGAVDSMYGYKYYKAHYWDNFDLRDDRLINTPLYDAKLTDYVNRLTYPTPDSVKKEADMLLAKTRGTEEMFKYTLAWFNNWAQESKIMGMDEVFVYLVENYYMKGDATWETSDNLAKIIKRAEEIAPNMIGNVAPELKLPDVNGKEQSLSDVKSKYTLVVFWSPDCGHCQKEIPVLDSLYKKVLKKKGVKVYAVRTDGDEKRWKEFIEKNDLNDWINVWDPNHKSDYQVKYDAYSTPTIYLLDQNKIIRGKKIDHSNIPELLNILEQKDKTAQNNAKS